MDDARPSLQFSAFPALLKWLLISSMIGVLAGGASTIFLLLLDRVTEIREAHFWIIALLPVVGFVIGWVYLRIGQSLEAGNNLILDEIHDPKKNIPLRMVPLILLSSLLTHLFGGSAGREGTAVQMGASLADQLSHPIRMSPMERRLLLMAGMSAGFSSVFGTPLAGMVFGFEVLSIGHLEYKAIFPCMIAALFGHLTTQALGIHHHLYVIGSVPIFSMKGLLVAALAGIIFGFVAMGFAKANHAVGLFFKRRVNYPPYRPLIGGVIVAALVFLTHSTRYIGLGTNVIDSAFTGNVPAWDFVAKFVMTVLTLGSGFKGGEVTPLFFIGATLGNALSQLLFLPAPLLAGMGLAAMLAGATNTPLACMLMGVELFGVPSAIYIGVACIMSYLFSGHTGIYSSQKITQRKHHLGRHEESPTK